MSELKVKLRPFRTPNFVLQETAQRPRQEGFSDAPKYHVGELPDEVLIEMCEQFKLEILQKARQWRKPHE